MGSVLGDHTRSVQNSPWIPYDGSKRCVVRVILEGDCVGMRSKGCIGVRARGSPWVPRGSVSKSAGIQ